jgi:hypothetical protein
MKLDLDALAKPLVGGRIDLARAVSIVQQAVFLIQLAEDALQDARGNEKMKAVLDTVNGWLKAVFPDEVEALWADARSRLPGIISFVVAVNNAFGLWAPKV